MADSQQTTSAQEQQDALEGISFYCVKGHEMTRRRRENDGTDMMNHQPCCTCLTLSTKDTAVTCTECQFDVCQACCIAIKNKTINENKMKGEANNSPKIILQNPQALFDQAQQLMGKEPKPNQEQLDQAVLLLRSALGLRQYILGEKHAAASPIWQLLAQVWKLQRQYDLALHALVKATKIEIDSTATSIPQLMISATIDQAVEAANYAMMQGMECQAQFRPREALQQLEYAHRLLVAVLATHDAIQDKKEGDTITDTKNNNDVEDAKLHVLALADVCRVLASVHVSLCAYQEALPFLQQAVHKLSQYFGPDNARTVTLSHDLTTLQHMMERHGLMTDGNDNDNNNSDVKHWYQRSDFVMDSKMPATTTKENVDNEPQGISVHWLKRGFWKQLQEAQLDATATLQQACDHLVGQATDNYVSQVPSDYLGKATVVVACPPSTTIADLINTLDDYCQEHELSDGEVFVWMDCLCGGNKSDPNIFVQAGRVLAILSPWNQPLAWQDAATLFQIFKAHETPKVPLTLVLPPAQTDALSHALKGDISDQIGQLYQALDALPVSSIVELINSTTAAPSLDPDTENPSTAPNRHKIFQILQTIFRPWVRHILMDQIQLYCSPMDGNKEEPSSSSQSYDVFQLQLCNKMGLLFWHYGEHKAALELLEDALSMTEAMYGPSVGDNDDTVVGAKHHESMATIYQNIANVLSDMGRYELALETNLKVLEITQSTWPDNHFKIATVCTKLGNLYRITGSLDKAMEFHQRALTLHTQWHGSNNNLGSADSYNDMGNVFFYKGDNDAALMEFRKALAIQESFLENYVHLSLATTHNYIGTVLRRQGKLNEALHEYRTALGIQEGILGPDHVQTAMTYSNLTSVLRKQDDLDAAMDMCQKVKTIYETQLGHYNPTTATAYQTLGAIQNDMDQVEDALTSFRTALEIRESVLGEDHPSTAETLQSIGTILFEIGDLDEAMVELRKAFDIVEPILGMEHPTTKELENAINAVLEA